MLCQRTAVFFSVFCTPHFSLLSADTNTWIRPTASLPCLHNGNASPDEVQCFQTQTSSHWKPTNTQLLLFNSSRSFPLTHLLNSLYLFATATWQGLTFRASVYMGYLFRQDSDCCQTVAWRIQGNCCTLVKTLPLLPQQEAEGEYEGKGMEGITGFQSRQHLPYLWAI